MSTEYVHTARPSGLTWTCDPIFGIVHSSGCTTCLHYMRHVATASPSETDPSFRAAVKERDSQYTIRYLNGFREGGYLRQEEFGQTTDILLEYRAKRDEALELANHRTAELLATKEELLHVQEQFRALQVLFDQMVEFTTSGEPNSGDRVTYVENLLLGSSESTDQENEAYRPEPTPSPRIHAPPLPTPPASPSRTQSNLPSPPSTPGTSYIVSPHPSALPSPSSVFLESSQSLAADQVDGSSADASPGDDTDVAQSSIAENFGTMSSPSSIDELKGLMAEAYKNNTQALLRVNELYMEAHLTRSKARSTLQRFLILEWKDVRPSFIPATPTSPSPEVAESDTPEIFVDASGWGIGFVLNGRWLAWKLKDSWRGEGRDNNWAEMVAVELGLHVAIAAGFHSQTIVVRSDNWGVVASLLTGRSKHATQPAILKEVIALTKRYDITLIPVWVSTLENPADNPSRGKFPSKALLFPVSVPLPARLTRFLRPSITFHALPR